MDLEVWEFVSDDGLVNDLHEDGIGKKVFSRENVSLHPNIMIDANYFQNFIDPQKKVVHVSIRADPPALPKSQIDESLKEEPKVPIQNNLLPLEKIKAREKIEPLKAGEQETMPLFFFEKMKGDEFVDMKMDLLKSTNRGFTSRNDLGMQQFEDDKGKHNGESNENSKNTAKIQIGENNNGGLSLLKKWAMAGIGAFCSFGFAAATISIIVLGSRQKVKPPAADSDASLPNLRR
ncbi:hypothetical protein Nepgr_021925 [Nepenthes gracilis]|uniref:DUF6821 domain-containing protein n=1 Tax=Nepenthes gracilis TaxID=150966 RepID=A0AAD3XXJ2_NEPGR|nr:hypothetical protein Nepgr_021925 [Nepenthes gracilis]